MHSTAVLATSSVHSVVTDWRSSTHGCDVKLFFKLGPSYWYFCQFFEFDGRNTSGLTGVSRSRGMPIRIQVLSKQFTALMCSLLLVPGRPSSVALAQEPQQATAAEDQGPKIPNDQLDSLVAPIALYPDPLLAQVLAAATYPLEIVQLQQWLTKNKDLKDKALADAVQKQPWDPNVQS